MTAPTENRATRLVCLVTPGHLATNPRLVKEADALVAAGYRVCVIACDYIAWAREAEAEFADRPWSVANRVRFGPLAPLHVRIRHALVMRGARFLFKAGLRGLAVATRAWNPVAPDLVSAALRVRADLYIAHYPAALPAAAAAAARHRTLYAFDAEDFHPGDTPDRPKFAVDKAILRVIEGGLLPGAVHVSAASPGISAAYADVYGIARPATVLNVFPKSHAPAAPTDRGDAHARPSVYWFSQTIGPDRGIECAVRAISISRVRPHLYLRGTISDAYRESLLELARTTGAEGHVHFFPPAAPSEMERLAAHHDAGLCGETGHSANRRIALTNKIFTFLLAGIPVLLSAIPAHSDIVADLGPAATLYDVDDADSLAAAYDAMLQDPARLEAARCHAWKLGQDRYNWDREQATLVRLVDRSLGITAGGTANSERTGHT
ncbi:MAG: hypothetical protein VYB54_16335 [Pseudomonadota bacterium]|nr:hypothetical protein [Pseudomonadota bacterium]